MSAPLWPAAKEKDFCSSQPPCDCVSVLCTVPPLYFHPSSPPSSFTSLPSSPQSHVCAPWFIPGSFWGGVTRRTEWGAGQPRRLWWSSDSLPTNQCSSQCLLTKPHGEQRPTYSSLSVYSYNTNTKHRADQDVLSQFMQFSVACVTLIQYIIW